ncbi:transposase [Palleronia caenipelagi]|uniref:Transposase n=1 Tax=Palleronia caenipelagi TaxID=2489174 RepID=A0A547PUS9_9RHOB|nr:transposase [Palleronia caenipelagi]TRD17851.1 transposase [Palleronia caenipelagi]
MSRKGQCLGFKLVRASGSNEPGDRLKAQNAPMESFFSSLKKELVHRHRFGPREQARAAIFGYIEVFYRPPTPPFSHRLPDTGSGVHRNEFENGRVGSTIRLPRNRDEVHRQIAEIEAQIKHTIISDDEMFQTAEILRSVSATGPVTVAMLIAEMPEPGQITGEQAAALTGLAPIAHESGALRGKRAIAGGRRSLRHVMFQAALVASHHNPILKTLAQRPQTAGKPHKVIVTAVARKLVTIANALCKSRQKWASQPD